MKISVIIPVYNVEKYLRECLDSVINQTHKDLEIICVNDASTDSSLSILEEYALKDSRIKIINNDKNSKLGPTRNHGMEYATGEYIHFFDSDDWLALDAYEKLVKIIENNNSPDLVQFEYQFVSMLNGEITKRPYYDHGFFNKSINIETEPNIIYIWDRHAWNKLYKFDFIKENNLLFNDYPCYEDIEFAFSVLIKAKNIYCIKDILLNYRYDNPNSLIGKYYLHNNYAYKSCANVIEQAKVLPKKIREKLLIFEIANFHIILFGCYKNKKISYEELRDWLVKIDYRPYNKKYFKKGVFVHTFDVMRYPECVYNLKNKIKKFLKLCFPKTYHYLIKYRDRLLGIQ